MKQWWKKIGFGFVIFTVAASPIFAQDTQSSKDFIMQYNEALNFQLLTPKLLDQFIADEAFKQKLLMVAAAFPKSGHPPIDIIAEGDTVAMRATFQGTNTGEFMGMPATGKSVNMQMIAIYKISGDKIVQDWVNADEMGMMEQLGILPATRANYDWTPSSTVTGDPGTLENNKTLVLNLIEDVWNQKNIENIEKYISPSYLFHIIPADAAGIDGAKAIINTFLTGIPDMHFQVESMVIAEGDKVVIPITYTGTHLGELMGMPASGRQLSFTGVCIYRIADGKIVEEWNCADMLGMVNQITSTSAAPNWDYYE